MRDQFIKNFDLLLYIGLLLWIILGIWGAILIKNAAAEWRATIANQEKTWQELSLFWPLFLIVVPGLIPTIMYAAYLSVRK